MIGYKPLLFAACVALASCGSEHKVSAKAPEPTVEGQTIRFPPDSPQIQTLRTAAVDAVTRERVRLSGRLVWDETLTARVSSPVAGKVVKLIAEPGKPVKVGDALALIASPEVGQAQSEAVQASAGLAVAQKSLSRERELHAAGVIADKELQQAEAEYRRAVAENERTRARARLYGGTSAGGVDQQLTLKAPVGGVVVERNANVGQEVRPEMAPPASPALFVVSNPSRLWIQLDVPESAVEAVKPGVPFEFRVVAMPGKRFTGTLVYVGASLDATTRMVRARGVVENPDHALKAEMFVSAEVTVERPGFMRIPSTAAILLGEQRYAFVDKGEGVYERRSIDAQDGAFGVAEVESGLNPGEKVVIEGPLLLQQILAGAGPAK